MLTWPAGPLARLIGREMGKGLDGTRGVQNEDPCLRWGMAADASNPPAGGQASSGPRARTLPLQSVANLLVRGLLRMPLVCRGIGKALITLYVVGRTSGRYYAVPVAYIPHDGALLFGTPFGWGRNLRTGQPVDIRFNGKRRPADVQVISDEAGVVELYTVMVRANHNFAKFNKIGLDQAGNPNPEDLHAAWATGARAFLLTPR
jgi:deazaflavin-dependent oxidoreductase (nitroreductase family)